LENLASDDNRDYLKSLLRAPFPNRSNTKFLVLHLHETLPHGAQILAALEAGSPQARHVTPMCQGLREGARMYLRIAEWSLGHSPLAVFPDSGYDATLSGDDLDRLDQFSMSEETDP
jgi:hypothetical protein